MPCRSDVTVIDVLRELGCVDDIHKVIEDYNSVMLCWRKISQLVESIIEVKLKPELLQHAEGKFKSVIKK